MMMRWGPAVLAFWLAAIAAGAGAAAAADETWEVREDRGGVLYLSLAPELTYDATSVYRGKSGLPPPEEALTRGNVTKKPQIAHILAAFPPGSRPELNFVTFGLSYPPGIEIVRYGASPEFCMQMATRDWPLSSEGIGVGWTFGKSDTNRVVEIGWVAIRAEKPGRLAIVPHPDTNMGCRLVSPRPPDQVPAAGWGYLGFGQDGYAPKPSFPGPPLGAACYADTVCIQLTRAEAEYYGETVVFLGENLGCGPEVNCTREAPAGACCLPDGGCAVLSRKECAGRDGIYMGNETICEARPCDDKSAAPPPRKGAR